MSNPQQPDLHSTGTLDGEGGPVPAENQPGHHPAEEQDKPDLDAFAAKLGTAPPEDRPGLREEPAPAPQARNRPPAVAFAAPAALVLILGLVFRRRRRGRRRR